MAEEYGKVYEATEERTKQVRCVVAFSVVEAHLAEGAGQRNILRGRREHPYYYAVRAFVSRVSFWRAVRQVTELKDVKAFGEVIANLMAAKTKADA